MLTPRAKCSLNQKQTPGADSHTPVAHAGIQVIHVGIYEPVISGNPLLASVAGRDIG